MCFKKEDENRACIPYGFSILLLNKFESTVSLLLAF